MTTPIEINPKTGLPIIYDQTPPLADHVAVPANRITPAPSAAEILEAENLDAHAAHPGI